MKYNLNQPVNKAIEWLLSNTEMLAKQKKEQLKEEFEEWFKSKDWARNSVTGSYVNPKDMCELSFIEGNKKRRDR